MRSLLPFLLSILVFFPAFSQENPQFKKILEELNVIDSIYDVNNPIWEGEHAENFAFRTTDQLLERTEALKEKLKELYDIPAGSLTFQDQVNRQIKIMQLENQVKQVDYKMYLIRFNSEGGFFNGPVFFLNRLPFNNVEDYDAYFTWLPDFVNYLEYNRGLLETGMEERIQVPKVIVKNVISLLEPWAPEDVTEHPFYRPIKNMPASLTEQEKETILQKAEEIIGGTIIPAYRNLKMFLEEEYLPSAPKQVGISAISNGKEYYEYRVKHFTTLDITPDSVFSLGHSEVKRIRGLMEEIIEELEYEGTFGEFINFLRTDPQFYPNSAKELLYKAAWLSKKAEGELPKLFSNLYELPFTVEPVPDDIAPNYTGGRYVRGSRERNAPGIYWVNTYDLQSRPYYTLPSLTLHEAVPGHHLQITLASELEDLPDFRRNYYISAFGEGWGLYSEFLGEEMGMYTTPYELFGRYTYEMWRACRLVVDVGLHYKGWTREQAVNFMAENTALSLHEINTEIDRYIGWPGQAVSYKMGELMIKKLRRKTENQLGEKFNIREFHEVILRNGSVPLPVLEEEVERYIAGKE